MGKHLLGFQTFWESSVEAPFQVVQVFLMDLLHIVAARTRALGDPPALGPAFGGRFDLAYLQRFGRRNTSFRNTPFVGALTLCGWTLLLRERTRVPSSSGGAISERREQ
jgi:hypothetical protein